MGTHRIQQDANRSAVRALAAALTSSELGGRVVGSARCRTEEPGLPHTPEPPV